MPRILALAVLVLGSVSCGPVQSTSYLMDAEVQLEAARTAGAPERAPYEWAAANLYMTKAKEEVGYSEYEVAIGYAQKAKTFATEARERATSSGRPEPASVTPAPGASAPSAPPLIVPVPAPTPEGGTK